MSATNHSSFDIYKASAGSGKTFSLTLHYLQLVLQQPHLYKRILAVTFTNKATAEMKERILHVLRWLATGHERAKPYEQALLTQLPNLDAAAIAAQATKVYQLILHDYSRFSITTIDAFVQRIIRSFAWELGIDGGFKLQLSQDLVKEDLAERLYLRLDDDKDLQDWVIGIAKERLEEGKRWDFRQDMLRLANELFKEKFKSFEEAMAQFDDEQVQAAFAALNKQVQATVQGIEKRWSETGKAVVDAVAAAGLDREDFHYGKAGFINYFFKAAEGQVTAPNSRVQEIADAPDKMVPKKADAATRQRIAELQPVIERRLQQLMGWYEEDVVPYTTAKAIRQNLGMLRLMRVFAEELAAYRKDNNALLISDTHHLLRELTKDTNASFIYEKTGHRYQHYLIDEFQDTSSFQWDNFLPLLTETLAQGNYNLIVGDVKQAIYRWRNGDWRLLLSTVQQQLQAFRPQVKTLQDNYRSTTQIIHFNNLLFHVAPQLLQASLSAEIAAAPAATRQLLTAKGYDSIFNDAYADSFQQIPATAADNGYVSMQYIVLQEDMNYTVEVLPLLYNQIQELLKEGYRPSDLCILTRTNGEARTIVEFLVAIQDVNAIPFGVISGDALMLKNNQAIQMLLCALRWLNNAKHTIALAQLRQLIYLQNGAATNRLEVFASNGDNAVLPYELQHNAAALKQLPLLELINQLIILLELSTVTKHAAYLLAFTDKVQEWLRYGDAGLQEFLLYWDEDGHKSSLPATATENAVEVVTIHKSKGLAYNILLMPFLDWDILPKGGPMAPTLWTDNSQTDFNSISMVPVQYKKELALSAFAEAYYEELVLTAMDNLNVLYVAFTRAKQRLYGWAPAKEKATKTKDSFPYKNVGKLMHAVAESQTPLPSADYVDVRKEWSKDKKQWRIGDVVTEKEKKAPATPTQQAPLLFTNWRNVLSVRSAGIDVKDGDEQSLPRKQGVLLHELLSKLTHPQQLPDALQQLRREGWVDDYQQMKLEQTLTDVLNMDALQPWHSGQYKRLAERNMLTADRQLRRPDLVLYNQDSCLVYDFKFTAADDQQEKHQQQVQAYMEQLSAMGFKQVSGFVIYGLEKKSVNVNARA